MGGWGVGDAEEGGGGGGYGDGDKGDDEGGGHGAVKFNDRAKYTGASQALPEVITYLDSRMEQVECGAKRLVEFFVPHVRRSRDGRSYMLQIDGLSDVRAKTCMPTPDTNKARGLFTSLMKSLVKEAGG